MFEYTGPRSTPVVSLADALAFLRVDAGSPDEPVVSALLDAATDWAEMVTERAWADRPGRLVVSDPAAPLPHGPKTLTAVIASGVALTAPQLAACTLDPYGTLTSPVPLTAGDVVEYVAGPAYLPAAVAGAIKIKLQVLYDRNPAVSESLEAIALQMIHLYRRDLSDA